MSNEPVVSPDGRYVLVNGEWLELAQQNVSLNDSVVAGDVSMTSTVNINTRSPAEEITNLAELALVKLDGGDMAAAKDAYTEAKKINVSLAIETFENTYATALGKGYTDIAETCAVRVQQTYVTVSGQDFGSAGMLWDVEGNHKLSAIRSKQEIALSNALSFLGSPAEIVNLSDTEIGSIPQDRIAQLYRCALIFKATGLMILMKTNEAFAKVDGVTSKFLAELRSEAAQHSDIGSGMMLNIMLIDIKAKFNKMSQWKEDFSDLEGVVETNKDWHEDFQMKQKQHQQCFVATAAYGTPYAKDIDALRMWRDLTLKKTVGGRVFIKFYYSIGPVVAWLVSKSKLIRFLVRKSLRPLIWALSNKNLNDVEEWRRMRAVRKVSMREALDGKSDVQ